MNESLNVKILESSIEIAKINEDINNKIFNFITKANYLVELSEDNYQIERTLKLNKISLKGYVLDSECCVNLNDNNITDYSIKELKDYLMQYEKYFNVDYTKYYLALSLYEMIEEIETKVDDKINLEIQKLSVLIINIANIKNISSSEYEQLYFDSKTKLYNYLNSNKIDEKSFEICIEMLNDVFNFYISGYPSIPEEYLYHDED